MSYCEALFIRQFKDEIIEADDSIAYYVSKLKEDEKLRLQQRKIAQKKEELLNAGKTESDRIKILYDKEVSQHNQNADRTIKMMDLKDNIYVK